jgi:hypothetical protein
VLAVAVQMGGESLVVRMGPPPGQQPVQSGLESADAAGQAVGG